MAIVKDREFWQSASYNNATYMQYYNRLVELAVSMFEWKNLPDTVDARFLELSLFGDGMSVFFLDEDIGYLSLRTTIGGRLNLYNIPTDRRAYASNGYNVPLNENNSVIIWNNLMHTNSVLEVSNFSKRLWDLDRTIDVNARAQKTPILIRCEENQRLTLKNIYKQYTGNEPVIYADKGLTARPIEVMQTGAPYVCDKLYELKTQIWNEALTYLGISNVSYQKKERLLQDEVQRNLGGTIASRYSRLQARKNAADEINRMFGLNIEVDFREGTSLAVDDLEQEVGEDIE